MRPSSEVIGPAPRRRSTAVGALIEGWRRALAAPVLALAVLGLTLATAFPLAIAVSRQVEAQLGSSETAARLLGGWDTDWAGDFESGAQGAGRTLTHEILGFGGTLATLSAIADATGPDPSLVAAILVYAGVWLFVSGGIMDRLARARPVRAAAFFAACGVFVWRFLRLSVVTVSAYALLFLWVHPLLFGSLYPRLIRNSTEEHQAFLVRAALYVVFFALVACLTAIVDFAKVRIVVEDRRSAIGALVAGWRFVVRRAGRVLLLYVLNLVVLAVILRLWLQASPSAAAATWVVLLVGQLYLLLRVWARLAFVASEIVFFQGELAHAQYAALPEPVWPDSPAAEAVRRLRTDR